MAILKKIIKWIYRIEDWVFDQLNEVNTSKPLNLESMNLPSESHLENYRRYECSKSRVFHRCLRSLSVNFSQYEFIDLGVGKGKTLLLAQRYQFKHYHGIDVSPVLCDISRQNLSKTSRWSIKCGDASHYQFGKGHKFIYLFNPFDETILSRVLANILASKRGDPSGDILIMYVNPIRRKKLEKHPCFKLVREWPDFDHNRSVRLYRARNLITVG